MHTAWLNDFTNWAHGALETQEINEYYLNVVFMVLKVVDCVCIVRVCLPCMSIRENGRVYETEEDRKDVMCVCWGGFELCLTSQTKFWLDWAEMNK